jgi:hypothetical protein
MAANSFDDVLNSLVADESDRGVLSDLVNKYPGIKDGWLRQSDYSRKLDSFRDTERQLESLKSADEKVKQWENWAAENWDPEANIPKMERYWKEKAEELEGQVGTDMTFDDISNFITEKGVITKNDLNTVLDSKAEEINRNFQGSAYFAAVIAEKQGEHMAEFSKPLKVRDFVAKLNEYGTNDLDIAYDKYVSEDRKSLAQKAKEREIEQIRAEERKKAEEEFAAKKFNQGLPVDQDEPGLGPLQAKMQMVGDPDALDKATLGSGTIAQIAAQQYRKDKLGISQS